MPLVGNAMDIGALENNGWHARREMMTAGIYIAPIRTLALLVDGELWYAPPNETNLDILTI